MSFLEYTALRIGIVPRPDRNALLWSGLQPVDSTESYVYTQKLGDHIFVLTLERSGSFSGTRDGHGASRRCQASTWIRIAPSVWA